MNRKPDASAVETFYDAEASRYDERRWNGAIGEHVHRTYDRLVDQALHDAAAGRCLEVGCGTGRLTTSLARRGFQVTAIDLSEEMLGMTRRALIREGVAERVELRRVDVREMADSGSGGYDVVCAFNVINHIPDYERAVEEMAAAVRPGGLLLLGFPSLHSLYFPYAKLVNLQKRSLRRGVYTQWLDVSRLTRQLQGLGLEVEAAYGMFHAPPLRDPRLSRAIAFVLAGLGSRVETGFLRPLASTQIMTFRKTE